MSDEQIEIEPPDDEGEIEIEAPEQPAAPQSFDIGSVIQNTLKSVADWYQAQPSVMDRTREARVKSDEMTARGEPITFENNPSRDLATDVAGGFAGGSNLRTPRMRTKSPTQKEVESGVDASKTAMATEPTGGGRAPIHDAKVDLQARAEKGKLIEDAISRAKNIAPNVGMDKAVQIEFRRLANDPKTKQMMSPEEYQDIEMAARGGLVRRAFRGLGQLSPTAGKIGGVLVAGGAGAYASGYGDKVGPAVATLGAAALAAKGARGAAGGMASRAANKAGNTAREGGLGMNARTGQDLMEQIKAINTRVEDVIKRNKGTVPTPEEKLYAEYRPLRDERNRIFREMRATPRM